MITPIRYAIWPRQIWKQTGLIDDSYVNLWGAIGLYDTLQAAQDAIASLTEQGVDMSQYILTSVSAT